MVPAVTPGGPAARANGPLDTHGGPAFNDLIQYSTEFRETRIFGKMSSHRLQENYSEEEIQVVTGVAQIQVRFCF